MSELKWLQHNCNSISVRINSTGGSVLEGYSIVSAILSSKVPVTTYIDGIAASMAGCIAVAGKKCYMMDYGTLMVHNPHGGEDEKVLKVIKDTLVTILSGRSGCTPEEMEKMMDKETWLNAAQALEKGFVDEIINTGKKIKKATVKKDINSLALIYNKILNNNMDKITAALKLKNDASEESVVSAIDALNTENKKLSDEKEALKNELDALKKEKADKEAAEKDALKNKATELVNKAKKEGKIAEAEVEKYVNLAIADFDTVSSMIEKMGNGKTAPKIFNGGSKPAGDDRSAWTIRDWETKDEKGLMDMYKNNREQYDLLYNNYYKKK